MLFLIILLIFTGSGLFSLEQMMEPVSSGLHARCLEIVQGWDSPWTPFYSALICGKTLPESDIKHALRTLGIIHIMVISGAHLIFMEKLWRSLPDFPFKRAGLILFLLFYSLSSGLKPPVVRALFSLLAMYLNKSKKWFWSPMWRVQISGMLTLCVFPGWIHSLSLQMSWLASLGMCQRKKWLSCSLTYFLLLPILAQWGGVHPFSILVNWLITPLISGILLPISLLVFIMPFLLPVTDALWSVVLWVLKQLARGSPSAPLWEWEKMDSFFIWIYIALVFFILQISHVFFHMKKKQLKL